MSGGSYDYAYIKVKDFADDVMMRSPSAARLAFIRHLYKVADAMKAIEWADSGDTAPGSEDAAIREVLDAKPIDVVRAAYAIAERANDQLGTALNDCREWLARHEVTHD